MRTLTGPISGAQAVLELLPEPTMVIDDAGTVVAANDAIAGLIGRRDVVGHTTGDVIVDDGEVAHRELARFRSTRGGLAAGFVTLRTVDGPVLHRCLGGRLDDGLVLVRVERRVRADDTGEISVLLAELETRRVAEERLTRLAYHDEVTGLLNRAGLDEQLGALSVGQRTVGVLYVDLDRFKAINDVFGHDAGDEALREVARRLEAVIRPGDVVGRRGGDEFVVLLADVDHVALSVVAERLADTLDRGHRMGDEIVELSGSVGATLLVPGERPVTALRRADAAMYRAKRSGGARVAIVLDGPELHRRVS